jgi:hypothetical protein
LNKESLEESKPSSPPANPASPTIKVENDEGSHKRFIEEVMEAAHVKKKQKTEEVAIGSWVAVKSLEEGKDSPLAGRSQKPTTKRHQVNSPLGRQLVFYGELTPRGIELFLTSSLNTAALTITSKADATTSIEANKVSNFYRWLGNSKNFAGMLTVLFTSWTKRYCEIERPSDR